VENENKSSKDQEISPVTAVLLYQKYGLLPMNISYNCPVKEKLHDRYCPCAEAHTSCPSSKITWWRVCRA